MTLKKEKEMMAKISELRKSKPLVKKYAEMDGGEDVIGGLRGNLDEIKKQLNEVRDAKKLQSQAMQKLNEARAKVMQDVPGLFEKREEINAQVREKIGERNKLRDEFNVKNREFQAYQNELYGLRRERARLERNARQSEWEQR